jgi:hypothetical protein
MREREKTICGKDGRGDQWLILREQVTDHPRNQVSDFRHDTFFVCTQSIQAQHIATRS